MHDHIEHTSTSRPRKRFAIVSLLLGIVSLPTLGLLFVGAILGIVFGVVALGKVKSNPARFGGKGLAIAGIVTSVLSLVIAIPGFIAAIAIPNLIRSRQAARETAALTDVIAIGKAQVLYSVTKGRGKFANLSTLGMEGLIDAALASGEKDGYVFRSEPLLAVGAYAMFDTTAKPTEAGTFGTGNRSFGSNETMVVYEAEGAVDLRGTPTNRAPANGTQVDFTRMESFYRSHDELLHSMTGRVLPEPAEIRLLLSLSF